MTKKAFQMEQRKLLRAVTVPFFLVVIMIMMHLLHTGFGATWELGVRPRSMAHFWGIATHVLQHGDFKHLLYNILPILFLASLVRYLFWDYRYRLLLWMWFIQGSLLWLIGRENSHHIGASGLVYGLVFFTFMLGILIPIRSMRALSLLMVFLYGGLIWGMIPLEGSTISWEGHLSGAISGIFMAFFYRKLLRACFKEKLYPPDEEDSDLQIEEIRKGKRLPYDGFLRDEE